MSSENTSARGPSAALGSAPGSRGAPKRVFELADHHKHLPLYETDSASDEGEGLTIVRHKSLGLVPNEPLGSPFLPAALWPYRDAEKLRTDYPLLLLPESSDRAVQPFGEALSQLLAGLHAQGRPARVLTDNLLRLERLVRRHVHNVNGPVSALSLLRDLGDPLAVELELGQSNAEALHADLEAMLGALPDDSAILNLTRDTDLFLLRHVANRELTLKRRTFRLEVEARLRELARLLEIEGYKAPEAQTAEAVSHSMGDESLVDANALVELLGKTRGSASMALARRRRLEHCTDVLHQYLEAESELVLLLGREPFAGELSRLPGVETRRVDDPIKQASQAFDEHVDHFLELFRALRVARLELEKPGGGYVPEQHDAWLASLDWQALTREELGILPWVVAVDDATRVASQDLPNLARLLLSGKPVHVLTRVQPAESPGATPGDDLSSFRLELGYFAISLREALVVQSMAATAEHLYHSLVRAADATRTSLLLVTQGPESGTAGGLGYWLEMHAALESRAHPLFVYDPEGGATWARRVDFSSNPSPELDWSVYSLDCTTNEGPTQTISQPFTFADFALLNAGFEKHFILVPEACSGDAGLVDVETYLGTPSADESNFVPFIWGVDSSGKVRQLAITRRLALACWDRLSFWRTLQELAGVRNEYTDAAVARVRKQADERAVEERQRLAAEHAAELERVRQSAAAEVMQKLAAALLDVDPNSLVGAGAATPRAAPSQEEPPTPPATSPAPTTEEPASPQDALGAENASQDSLEFDDPWIDSALCTSCNDCMNINPLLFVYDENKQARIGDVESGTYAQLVKAAKQCPARCIHPGKPRDPDEPGLQELIGEAEPFN